MTAMNLVTMPRPVPLRSMALAVVGGLVCAFAIGKALPVTMDTVQAHSRRSVPPPRKARRSTRSS